MKRFVICLDGTWNNASREIVREEGSRVYLPTNVLKIARATLLEHPEGVLQVTYYDAGCGLDEPSSGLRFSHEQAR